MKLLHIKVCLWIFRGVVLYKGSFLSSGNEKNPWAWIYKEVSLPRYSSDLSYTVNGSDTL